MHSTGHDKLEQFTSNATNPQSLAIATTAGVVAGATACLVGVYLLGLGRLGAHRRPDSDANHAE